MQALISDGKSMAEWFGQIDMQLSELRREVRNVAPDLIVYFGDLAWRSVGTLGHGDIYTFGNDTDPEGANHAPYGTLIARDPMQRGAGLVADMDILDVAPTILATMGIPVPEDMEGQTLSFTTS